MYKVFIDAGHNYSIVDTGATGNGLREQDITYYIASHIEKFLIKMGASVKMSRNNLTDNVISGGTVSDSLRARYSSANSWGADIFVSIHCNAGGGTGSEVYVYKTGGNAEKLASNILNGILWNTDLKSRGVKTANYSVIKNTTMPAVLVETAFIDTESDAAILKSQSGQRMIAKGIAEGIMEYLGIVYLDGWDKDESEEVQTDKLTTPNDIVWELSQRGFVTDKDGMIAEMEQNPNGRLYWLARKVANS